MKSIILILGFVVLTFQKQYVGIIDDNTFQDLSRCDPDIIYRPDPFQVTGTAAYSIPPELVIINMGLDVLKPTAQEAVQQSANIMDKAITAIKKLNVTVDEIATSDLSLQESTQWVYNQTSQTGQNVFLGYQVTQTLTITTIQVNKAGDIIDAGISNGMNRVDSVSFDAKPETKKTIKDDLIAFAVDDARIKAEKALSVINYQIQSLKSVNLNDYQFITPNPQTSYMNYQSNQIQTNTGQSQVYAETQVVQATISASYIIEPIPNK